MMSTEICEEVSAQAGTETASTTPCGFETYRWSEAPGEFAPHGVICRNEPVSKWDALGLRPLHPSEEIQVIDSLLEALENYGLGPLEWQNDPLRTGVTYERYVAFYGADALQRSDLNSSGGELLKKLLSGAFSREVMSPADVARRVWVDVGTALAGDIQEFGRELSYFRVPVLWEESAERRKKQELEAYCAVVYHTRLNQIAGMLVVGFGPRWYGYKPMPSGLNAKQYGVLYFRAKVDPDANVSGMVKPTVDRQSLRVGRKPQ